MFVLSLMPGHNSNFSFWFWLQREEREISLFLVQVRCGASTLHSEFRLFQARKLLIIFKTSEAVYK